MQLTPQLSCSPQHVWICIWHTTRTSHLWKARFDFCLYCFNNDSFSLNPSLSSSSKFLSQHSSKSFATRPTPAADNSNIIFCFFVDRHFLSCSDGLKSQIVVSVQTSQIGPMWVKTSQSIHKSQNYPKYPFRSQNYPKYPYPRVKTTQSIHKCQNYPPWFLLLLLWWALADSWDSVVWYISQVKGSWILNLMIKNWTFSWTIVNASFFFCW